MTVAASPRLTGPPALTLPPKLSSAAFTLRLMATTTGRKAEAHLARRQRTAIG
jgi:hypothetical protein